MSRSAGGMAGSQPRSNSWRSRFTAKAKRLAADSTRLNDPPQEAQFDDDIQAILIKSRRLKPIRVGTSLRSPHPLIEDVKDEWKHHDAYQNMSMEQRLRSFDRERKLTVAIEVSEVQRTRALSIMDSLIQRIEKVGGKIDIRPRRCLLYTSPRPRD